MKNVQVIILPEVMKCLSKKETGIHVLINNLRNNVIGRHNLSELASNLKRSLRDIMFGTKVGECSRFCSCFFLQVDLYRWQHIRKQSGSKPYGLLRLAMMHQHNIFFHVSVR